MTMYDETEYAMQSEGIEKAARGSNQIPQAMKALEEAVMVLDKHAGRLLDSAVAALQPEETANDAAPLAAMREPTAPLALQIEDIAGRVRRISRSLASASDRMQL